MTRLVLLKHLLGLFDWRERKLLLALSAMMIIGAGLEVLGLGAIVPFIGIRRNPAVIQQNQWLHSAYIALGVESTRDFLMIVGCGLLVLFIVKNGFLALLGYVQNKFALDKQTSLSRRLFDAYMRNPYTFHLQHNTAVLLRNINGEVTSLVNGIVVPSLLLLNELLVFTCVLVMLLMIEPYVAFTTLMIIGALMLIFQQLIRPALSSYGRKRVAQGGEMNKWVNQGLGSIKESKILGREEYFVAAHHVSSMEYAKSTLLFLVLNI